MAACGAAPSVQERERGRGCPPSTRVDEGQSPALPTQGARRATAQWPGAAQRPQKPTPLVTVIGPTQFLIAWRAQAGEGRAQ
eukprot:7191476-Prymnesium_polylepis.1